jgi:ubiquinone/menaquinone biosynthesis C-methylase UbiE
LRVNSLNHADSGPESYDHLWAERASNLSPDDVERIEAVLSLIPSDCGSIVDVGCGDGRIANRLISRYGQVVGLERSREALRHVKAEKILGSIDSLPFADRSFGLVLCAEVLEHLPFRVYPKAIEEVQRVAAKYILVTVPNRENLERSLITCPYCGCEFNPSRHIRSFDSEAVAALFGQFRPQAMEFCSTAKVYPSLLVRVAESMKLLPRNPFVTAALCPQCGYSPLLSCETTLGANKTERGSLSARLLSLARRFPTRKRGKYLMALYRRW